jgi:hypothetical protein
MDRVEMAALRQVAADLEERPVEVRRNVILMHRELAADRSLPPDERMEEAERADILERLLEMAGKAKGARR